MAGSVGGRARTVRPDGYALQELIGFTSDTRIAVVAMRLETGAIEFVYQVSTVDTSPPTQIVQLPGEGTNWAGRDTPPGRHAAAVHRQHCVRGTQLAMERPRQARRQHHRRRVRTRLIPHPPSQADVDGRRYSRCPAAGAPLLADSLGWLHVDGYLEAAPGRRRQATFHNDFHVGGGVSGHTGLPVYVRVAMEQSG